MTLPVNDIFYSLQGEGHFTGRAATFVRLSGCNLKCPFCDTDHRRHKMMSVDSIVDAVIAYQSRHVVITGGEPGLHRLAPLIDALHRYDRFVQIETNGTITLPENADWITCSPKDEPVNLHRVDEIKLLYLPRYLDGTDTPDATLSRLIDSRVARGAELRLQPCDTGEPYTNSRILDATVDYIRRNPQWQLSLQTHKLIDIP